MSSDSCPIASERLRWLASRARTLAAVYLVVLFIATHTPSVPTSGYSVSDKAAHFGAYFLLTISVLVGWELTIGVLQPKHYFAVWLAGTLYGAFDELTQIPVGRTCDMHDWIADIAGILAGLVVFRVLNGVMRKGVVWWAASPLRVRADSGPASWGQEAVPPQESGRGPG